MAPSDKITRIRNEIAFERSQLNREAVVKEWQRKLREAEREQDTDTSDRHTT